jgi:copper transport protein
MRARRGATVVLSAALMVGLTQTDAWAHAGLMGSDPRAGATLGAAPTVVRLTFSEQPEASLSSIRVLDSRGTARQSGRPQPVTGDRLTLTVPVPRITRGVYTVSWRVVSAVDGHASSGALAFGVGVSPKGAAVGARSNAGTSALELAARWVLLAGLALLLGAALAGAAGFGGSTGSDLRLADGSWLLAAAGLVLLAVAQLDTADAALSTLLDTPVGSALVWRGLALAAAGAALLAARRRPRARRPALLAAAMAALGAIVAHVAAGHAAAGSWSHALTVSAQAAHFAAAGIWLGGLVALLLGVRGAASKQKAAAVRRFSVLALAALVTVAATGTLRAIDELPSLDSLTSSGYGRAIVVKVVLLALIVALGARQRRRSVPAAERDLQPLRRTSRPELALAAAALGAAAVLGTIAPPVAGQPGGPRGLKAEGADIATSTRVRLTTASAEPGPNSFVARVEDYDSHAPVPAQRVRLRFAALDDPGIEPTTLDLRPASADGTYRGTGPNLAFDGRWGVTAEVQTTREAVEVPLELDVRGPPNFVSVLRAPGQPPAYTMQVATLGEIRITPDPERPGPSSVAIDVFDPFESELPVERVVVTTRAHGGPTQQRPVRRLGPGRFAISAQLDKGPYAIAVVAHARGGVRLRGVFELDIPSR